jgi:phage head maturation protease
MPQANKDTGKHLIRAQFVPSTMNAEKRTIDVTFATDTPVLRYSWARDEYYNEILDMNGMDMARAANGLPVLDNHGRWGSVGQILGRAENVRIENGVGVATIRFSKRSNVQDIVDDVTDGIIRDISFGYQVLSYERMEKEEGKQYPDYYARKWQPNEISFVTIPADPKAGVRSEGDDTPEPEFIDNQNRGLELNMTEAEKKALRDAERQRAADITKAVAVAGLSAEFARGLIDNENMTVEGARAAIDAEKARIESDPTKAREEGAKAERKRAADIVSAVKAAKLSDDFARTLIDEGKTIDEARAAIIEEFGKADPNKGTRAQVSIEADAQDKFRAGMEEAILHRAEPGNKELREKVKGSEFRGMDLMDMAREAVEQAGGNTRGMTKQEIAKASLNIVTNGQRSFFGMHSTSDFPIILGNTINRTLRAQYEMQPQTFKPFTRQSSFKDFRPKTVTQLSGMIDKFVEVKEGGEYKSSTLTEGKETYQLAKYGRKIAVTWESLINDDLSAFSRIPQAIAQKAAQLESDIVWGILLGNPTMGDGTALFHADHDNLAGAGSAINHTALSEARAAMRKQKGLEGDFINVMASYLLVGPDKETEAQQIINAAIVATKTADTNVFRSSLDIIVEPRVTGNQWFLSAAPSQIDTIEYSYLEGESGLFTESREGFDIDGVEVKARLVFGAKAIDWRGLWRNAGN